MRNRRPGARGHNWNPLKRRAQVWGNLNGGSWCGNAADYPRPVVPQSLEISLEIKAIEECLGLRRRVSEAFGRETWRGFRGDDSGPEVESGPTDNGWGTEETDEDRERVREHCGMALHVRM